MKILYYILTIVAGASLILGVIIKIWMPETMSLPHWLQPLTLWRGGVGAAALAIVFLLMDIRDVLVKKK